MRTNKTNNHKIIQNDVYNFMYKWMRHLGQNYVDITPRNYVNMNKEKMDRFIDKLCEQKYTKHETHSHIHHVTNHQQPDVLVCETFCMNGDNIIKIVGIDNYGYIAISAFGTLVEYKHCYKVNNFGTFQLIDELVEIIKKFNSTNIDEWILMLKELKQIQEHVMLA